MDVTIQDYGMVCAMGTSVSACKTSLFTGQLPPLSRRTVVDGTEFPVFEVADSPPLPPTFKAFECRNNRLAYACFQQISASVASVAQTVPMERIGVVIGSSTSGLAASEFAFQTKKKDGRYPDNYHFHTQHAMGSLSRFIAELSGARGPIYTVSTACSSAAKAILSARGLIESNICDAVITGGVDSLCDLTVNGFGALGQLSKKRMNPLSENRSGLNIGEGGALFVLSRTPGKLTIWGGGESMDAYHMSAPLPDGSGASLAMQRAMDDARIAPARVAYVNLHGTATKANDSMESQAVHRIVPNALVSSSKPFIGHCLGAAGALEAALCCISLDDARHRLPPHVFDGNYDKALPPLKIAMSEDTSPGPTRENCCYLSNSFAFGGNNCTLVIGHSRGGSQ